MGVEDNSDVGEWMARVFISLIRLVIMNGKNGVTVIEREKKREGGGEKMSKKEKRDSNSSK